MYYQHIKSVKKGGFAITELHIRGEPPDKIVKVSDNEVYAVYDGKYKQTIKAEGSGDERHNFTETIEVIKK